jgi:hypothetical protein
VINVDEDHPKEEYHVKKEKTMLRYKEMFLTNFLSNKLEYFLINQDIHLIYDQEVHYVMVNK